MIIKVGSYYHLISPNTGRLLGRFKTLKAARFRERQINYFKNKR